MSRRERTRFGRLAAEACRQLGARPLITVALATLLAAIIVGVFLSESNARVDSWRATDDLVGAGYTTLLLERDDSAREDFGWADCDAASGLSGVTVVVGLSEAEEVRLWSERGAGFTIRYATASINNYLAHVDPVSAGYWSTSQVFFDQDAIAATERGTGEFVAAITAKAERVVAQALTVRLTSLGGGFSGNGVIMGPDPQAVESCVVLVEIDRRSEVAATMDRVFPVLDGFSQRWALSNADTFESPRQRYEARPSQWYWLIGTIAFAVIWLFAVRLRRNDFAVYVVAGLDAGRLSVLSLCELLGIILLGVGLSALLIVPTVVADGLVDSLDDGLRAATRALIAVAGVTAITTVYASTRVAQRSLDALKDR
jgi:hypothetical protein